MHGHRSSLGYVKQEKKMLIKERERKTTKRGSFTLS